jgi:hypothetical protein
MASDELQAITAEPDPVLRNQAITAHYVRLSRRMEQVVGSTDANWLHFGAWASASAGVVIRGDHVPIELPIDAGREAVLAGNTAIIADVAPRFDRFLEIAGTSRSLVEDVSHDHLLTETSRLADAFRCYAVLATTDVTSASDRAQLMLRANLGIAHHEQAFADALIDAAIPGQGLVGRLATATIVLRFPDGDLRVSRDVPAPAYLDGRQWPDDLDPISDPQLLRLADEYGQHLDSTRNSDAPDWQDLDERMGYIFCLFRAFQQDPAIRTAPRTR